MGNPGLAIEAIGLHKSLGGRPVLRGVDLGIETGRTVCVVGCSGCGKTTLLRHVCGLLKPDGGRVLVGGRDISAASGKELEAIRRNIGVLFQSAALLGSLTVLENVALPLIEHGVRPLSKARETARECLRMVRLEGYESYMPAELSGGMRKRVGVARAIAERPGIMLYDEPTSGLDPVTGATILELIRDLRDRMNVSSLVITHDMEAAYRIADGIAMLHEGRIVAFGPPEVFRASSNPVVRQFVEGRSDGPMSEIGAAGARRGG